MLTTRTLTDFRDILGAFERAHPRWHALMAKAVDGKDVPSMRELFDGAPSAVTEHARFMDLWRILAQAEHEADTTTVVAPPPTFSEG